MDTKDTATPLPILKLSKQAGAGVKLENALPCLFPFLFLLSHSLKDILFVSLTSEKMYFALLCWLCIWIGLLSIAFIFLELAKKVI